MARKIGVENNFGKVVCVLCRYSNKGLYCDEPNIKPAYTFSYSKSEGNKIAEMIAKYRIHLNFPFVLLDLIPCYKNGAYYSHFISISHFVLEMLKSKRFDSLNDLIKMFTDIVENIEKGDYTPTLNKQLNNYMFKDFEREHLFNQVMNNIRRNSVLLQDRNCK